MATVRKKGRRKTNLFYQNEETYSFHFNFEPVSICGDMIFVSSNVLGSKSNASHHNVYYLLVCNFVIKFGRVFAVSILNERKYYAWLLIIPWVRWKWGVLTCFANSSCFTNHINEVFLWSWSQKSLFRISSTKLRMKGCRFVGIFFAINYVICQAI